MVWTQFTWFWGLLSYTASHKQAGWNWRWDVKIYPISDKQQSKIPLLRPEEETFIPVEKVCAQAVLLEAVYIHKSSSLRKISSKDISVLIYSKTLILNGTTSIFPIVLLFPKAKNSVVT